MEIKVTRKEFTDKSVIGEMEIDGEFLCYTLEDPPRLTKIPGKTGIPAGRYEVVIDLSTRFKRLMPHILNVPGFEGIRIHAGNRAVDTEGCVLLGMTRGLDFVGQSREAVESFMFELGEGLRDGKVFITVT